MKKSEKNLSVAYGRDVSISSYGIIASTFILLVAFYYLLSTTFDTPLVREIGILEMFLIAVASHKISWLLSKDTVFTFVRAPFSKFNSMVGPGAITSESPRGKGMRYVLGELLTCPWCLNMWAVTVLVLSYFLFPDIVMAVVVLFAILMLADVLHILYIMLGNAMKRSNPPS